MELIVQVIDWILRVTGLGSIIILIINLFIKDYEYIENIEVISNPTEEELNRCKCYEEYNEKNDTAENTLFMPLSCNVKILKLYETKLTEKGKLKKGRLLIKFKNLEPYHGVLFYIIRGCGAPNYILEWKIDYGFKGREELYENGFNGNNNKLITQYSYGIISKIRKILMLK